MIYTAIFKRLFDLFFALLFLLLLSPLLILISVAIKIASGNAPIFYGHQRLGKNGVIFTCWKFRTMIPKAQEKLQDILQNDPTLAQEFNQTQKLKRDPRIIPGIGHFLRRSSMDELPQFFNVLKGQMSIIGPRPITPSELNHYGEHQALFLSVLPGITGLWQTSGRNNLSYQSRVNLDIYYIRHRSLWLDLNIVLKTLITIIKGSGY
ncbi:sugar transferase [Entomospira culicis]|uniref:Sugar transferase n=1 Tax=Entomospira culicis TaxID=2719989 RepID=A0A968GHK7_9SPIO|nr:sugar transferase [Entomospira culicis]NIZ18952.1 sugar transferase [Entomospira culicis]NIZ69167.1 sugar transferase [Entomospira culicis]WDI37754.1 sugar transferase [Entomospira culicis]WDI39382.1 sugar transferase [Entomospira culicis]